MVVHEPEPRPRNLGGRSPFQRELGFSIEHLSDGDILLFLRHGLGRRIVRSVSEMTVISKTVPHPSTTTLTLFKAS